MSTSSAVPFHLLAVASGQRQTAEDLLRSLAALDDALAALHAGCEPTRIAAVVDPLPDGRRLAAALLELADWTAAVGRAFQLADDGLPFGVVTVDDGQLSLLPAGVAPHAGLLDDIAGLSPAGVAALFAELDPTMIERLVTERPEVIGGLDGVPFTVRYRANHRLVLRDLATAAAAERNGASADERHDAAVRAARLRILRDDQVVLYDPRGHRIAVVFGDITTATNIAVEVPGMSNPYGSFTGRARTDASHLAAEMAGLRPGATATVAWLGYDSPSYREVTSPDDSIEGGKRLVAFVQGMGLNGGQALTLVGHSYGTMVVGRAEAGGAGARNIVLLGSPGTGADSASALRAPKGGGVYVERAPQDPVAGLEAFGTDPASPAFGATRLTTNAPGRPIVTGHSEYFTPGSEALRNTAAVAGGGRPAVQSPSVGDRVVGAQEAIEDRVGPMPLPAPLPGAPLPVSPAPLVHVIADHYNGPGAGVIDAVDRFDRTVAGGVHTVERNVIDGGIKGAKRVASTPARVVRWLAD